MKARVALGGVPLAATSPIVWRFQTGVAPFKTTMSVNRRQWDRLKDKMGQPIDLAVQDARNVLVTIKSLTILHVVPSPSPNLVSFLVSDLRWKWPYKLIVRDYNVPKKTGDRTAFLENVPVENFVTVDKYEYRPSSLNPEGIKWTSREAIEDILTQLVGDGGYTVDGWPIMDGLEIAQEGSFSLQNVLLRDQGDVALGRMMGMVPGAALYVDQEGKVRVFDGADLEAARAYAQDQLPFATWDGEKIEMVDRAKVRPSKVNVHYQREVEVLFDYSDDYNETSARPGRNTPFIENVIPTVDPETRLLGVWDPETNTQRFDTVPPGTWVPVKDLLAAWDFDRPAGTAPWTFDTVRSQWVVGDLDGVWGVEADSNEYGNVLMRIQAFKQHFRQTFRINRRYMERIRDIEAVRVSLLDPVTGARAPSQAWGQYSFALTEKGMRVPSRKNGDKADVYRNVDLLEDAQAAGESVIKYPPGPAQVTILDKDLGIFRVDWLMDPYGCVKSFMPGLLVNDGGQTASVSRNLKEQGRKPMAPGARSESAANGIYLSRTMDMKVILTVVPAAPNNARQFHRVPVEASEIADIFQAEFAIEDGDGPELNVFIPPGEVSARFAWKSDTAAASTMADLLGLNEENNNEGGIEEQELPGFELVNGRNEIAAHSKAVAAEAIAPFADSIQGVKTTRMPNEGIKLVGNMDSAAMAISAAPSAKVVAVHEFPGRQRPISRMALLPESTREIVLGVLPGIKAAT